MRFVARLWRVLGHCPGSLLTDALRRTSGYESRLESLPQSDVQGPPGFTDAPELLVAGAVERDRSLCDRGDVIRVLNLLRLDPPRIQQIPDIRADGTERGQVPETEADGHLQPVPERPFRRGSDRRGVDERHDRDVVDGPVGADAEFPGEQHRRRSSLGRSLGGEGLGASFCELILLGVGVAWIGAELWSLPQRPVPALIVL